MATKRATPPRKRIRRSPDEARQLILEAAIRVFAERGPEAAGLKAVAQAAGVSHALIAHYFGTYEALVQAAVEHAMSMLRTRLIERMLQKPDASPEEMVELYIDIALEPWYGRLAVWMLFSEREGSSVLAPRLLADMKLIVTATEQMLRKRMHPAPTRRQAEAMVVGVWSLVVGYVAANGFIWRALGQKPGPSRDRDLRDTIVALTRSYFST